MGVSAGADVGGESLARHGNSDDTVDDSQPKPDGDRASQQVAATVPVWIPHGVSRHCGLPTTVTNA